MTICRKDRGKSRHVSEKMTEDEVRIVYITDHSLNLLKNFEIYSRIATPYIVEIFKSRKNGRDSDEKRMSLSRHSEPNFIAKKLALL